MPNAATTRFTTRQGQVRMDFFAWTLMKAAIVAQGEGYTRKLVPRGRIELPTSSLPMTRSTTELPRRCRLQIAALAYDLPDEKTV